VPEAAVSNRKQNLRLFDHLVGAGKQIRWHGTLAHNKADALLVGPDAFFVSRRLQLAILAARHALPAVYNVREYTEAGGLMSWNQR
jgi:putative ABC transport system substrate-binding protein